MFTSMLLNLFTADLDRSVAFYRDQLGGTQTFQYPPQGRPEHVELRIGDVTIAISSYDAAERAGLPTPSPGHPMEIAIECDSAMTPSPSCGRPEHRCSENRSTTWRGFAGPTSLIRTGTGSRW
jgi:hypothetical protein